ncbi:hypothetical protein SAMN02745132_04881, partial [Enterovibrio nigricans DSM 22720]
MYTLLRILFFNKGVVAKNSIGRISPRRFLKLRVNYLDIKESI